MERPGIGVPVQTLSGPQQSVRRSSSPGNAPAQLPPSVVVAATFKSAEVH
jgi:hypothetical protein